MFQEISITLLNIFRGVRRMMKKRNNFLIKKYELFLVWTLLTHHACPQTQTIDSRRQTEGGRQYMTGPDPEIQSCHAITWMSHDSFFHGAMRYATRTCILKAVIQYCEQCLYTGQLTGCLQYLYFPTIFDNFCCLPSRPCQKWFKQVFVNKAAQWGKKCSFFSHLFFCSVEPVLGGHSHNAVRERFMWHSRDCVTILNFVT